MSVARLMLEQISMAKALATTFSVVDCSNMARKEGC